MIEMLNKVSKEEYNKWSLAIRDHLIDSKEFCEAQIIGLTISRFPEVDTRPIIEAAWALGKNIAVPRCNPKTKTMDFRLIHSFEDLEVVYLALQEPKITETKSVSKNEIDLQIVPGVVYSNKGYRIGFGGGYYDRYMVKFKGNAMSLAFQCQTGHLVPVQEHDIPVNKIITERSIIYCQKGDNSE